MNDDDYSPTLDESFIRQTDDMGGQHPAEEKKYIVFHEQLMELFTVCKECYSPCKPPTCRMMGTLLSVETECARGHFTTWQSQPVLSGKPAGNLLLTAEILFSGSSIASTLRMLELMGVQVICERTFYNYQRGYLLPAIERIYKLRQNELFDALSGATVDLAGDGRCDSPGFSSKYMSYNLHVAQLNKILHTEQVQVGETDDVKSSVLMEKQGLIQGLKAIRDKGVIIKSLTTDRHPAIKKHMATQEPSIQHYFDVWYISKGIKKKLAAASKKSGCSELGLWVISIE
ncbi:uncharacterized protein LOC135385407 [Ornithodoros turicata]|uniref:uncharacterized protein LOC135385407 n=1 Tax=Ornithodoros turicata TaxID=34597 RepID=UPI00313A2233